MIARLLAPSARRDLTEQAWMRGTAFWGRETASGRTVNASTALQHVTVYACVRLIAETLATLPLQVYQEMQPRGRRLAPSHPWYRPIHRRPNPYMTNVAFWEAIIGHAVLRGNGYAEKVPQADGTWQLWPLRVDRMRLEREDDGTPVYLYRTPNGPEAPISRDRVFHLHGWGSDGFQGYSPIALARETVGLGLALEEYGARLFANGARPGGVLQTKDTLSDEAFERMSASWTDAHKGLENSHRVAILESGVSWQSIGMNADDAQFLESMRFSREQIASLFAVKPHMVGDLSHATFSNIESQSIEHVRDTIRPWAVRTESTCEMDLNFADGYSAKFSLEGLLRGDLASRTAAYATLRNWGLRSANDIAEIEDWNPIPADKGGDDYLIPLNMVVAGSEPPAPTQSASRSLPEARAIGSAASRLRLADRYERLFRDAARRLVTREVAEVGAAAEKHLFRRDAFTFSQWLEEYYRDFPAIASERMRSVMATYGESVLEDAAAEIDSADTLLEEMAPLIDAYVKDFGEHYAGSSLGQLEAIVRDSVDEGADPYDVVTDRLDEWSEKRAEKVSLLETVALAGMLTRARWRRGGIRRIIWVAQGSRTCPFCRRLGGKVVGIEQAFAEKDEQIDGDDTNPPLKVGRKTTHPPIHSACKCGLKPERG